MLILSYLIIIFIFHQEYSKKLILISLSLELVSYLVKYFALFFALIKSKWRIFNKNQVITDLKLFVNIMDNINNLPSLYIAKEDTWYVKTS